MTDAPDPRAEIRSFLSTRRARLTPDEVGLRTGGGVRRVPGLRREEVAQLAGVSIEYYNHLERGHAEGVSPEVLGAIARALRLDRDERDHLDDLVRLSQGRTSAVHSAKRDLVRPGLQQMIDAIDAPAFVQNARLDRLAANALGRVLYSLPQDGSGDRFNYAEFLFLDPRAPRLHRDYEVATRSAVALLRAALGRTPHDTGLLELVDSLSDASDAFRALWAEHDVFRYRVGDKRFTHTSGVDLDFSYESMESPTDAGYVLLVYGMTPGSATEQSMRRLLRIEEERRAALTLVESSSGGAPRVA